MSVSFIRSRRAHKSGVPSAASTSTVCNQFDDKDDLLRTAIRFYADTSLAVTEARCEGLSGLGDKLDVVFERLVVYPWDRIQVTPYGNEFLTGFRNAARQEIALANLRYSAMLETMLEPCAAPLSDNGLSVRQSCDLIQASW